MRSYGCGDVDVGLLVCNAMWTCRQLINHCKNEENFVKFVW
jgi:hypothetical protein